jgi:Rieske 2Fe-2S family protein
VRIAQGVLFISFAARPLDFKNVADLLRATTAPYGWAEAKVAHRQMYQVAANWKLTVENYVECYHCAPAHPEYARTHALEQPLDHIAQLNARMEERTRALGVEILNVGNHWQNSAAGHEATHYSRYALYDGVLTGSADGALIAPLMGQFKQSDGGVTSIHIGGSSFLVAYADHGVIYRFIPRSWQSTDIELTWLVRGDAIEGRDYDLDRLTWLWKVTTDQDKLIIEHTAAGVRSHYFRPGPCAPMEYQELRFISWYLDELQLDGASAERARAGGVAGNRQPQAV